jgi:hypothetical protein
MASRRTGSAGRRNTVQEVTGQWATSVAEFLAEKIDVRIEAAEPPLAFASNRSR